MKVTVRFDEAAAMTPSEVKVRQQQAQTVRERNQQWNEALQRPGIGKSFFALSYVWPENGGGK